MESILETAKKLISGSIQEDSIVADFTMGNGHDTLFWQALCRKERSMPLISSPRRWKIPVRS